MADVRPDARIRACLIECWSLEGDAITRTAEVDSSLAGVGFAAGVGGGTETDLALAERFDDVA